MSYEFPPLNGISVVIENYHAPPNSAVSVVVRDLPWTVGDAYSVPSNLAVTAVVVEVSAPTAHQVTAQLPHAVTGADPTFGLVVGRSPHQVTATVGNRTYSPATSPVTVVVASSNLYEGYGEVSVPITAAGLGSHGVRGTGSAAVSVSASGSGEFVTPSFVVGNGAVNCTLFAEGYGSHGVRGDGASTYSLNLSAVGVGRSGVRGGGSALLGVTANSIGEHTRYEVRGSVRESEEGILLVRRVRVYDRLSGVLVGQQDSASGRFHVHCGLEPAEYTIMVIDLSEGAEDFIPPVTNRVSSVLAMDSE